MAIAIQVNQKQTFTLGERMLYARNLAGIIFSCLGYTDQDKAKGTSKRCLAIITALQRDDMQKAFPADRLHWVGGSLEALKNVPIRNIPVPIPPPKPHKFPDLAVGWTKVRPQKEGEPITWKLHVYKQEMSADKTSLNMMAIYFDKVEEFSQRIGIWGVEAPSCARIKGCTCLVCCPNKYSCIPRNIWLRIAFCCGCTDTLSVADDYRKKRNVANCVAIENRAYSYRGVPYIPILVPISHPPGSRPVNRNETFNQSVAQTPHAWWEEPSQASK